VALSVIVRDAVSGLDVDGVKATPIEQLAPAATELPQESATSAKSAAFVPVIVRLLIFNTVSVPLVNVVIWVLLITAISWFGKERLVGDTLTVAEVPVPLRLRDWGLPLAVSVKLTEADRLPLAVGSNVTLIVQLAPTATELPQVFV
jgi:hypothetical protein